MQLDHESHITSQAREPQNFPSRPYGFYCRWHLLQTTGASISANIGGRLRYKGGGVGVLRRQRALKAR